MSTKSNLRAFGAAFTAGGIGIKDIIAKKEASERADTQEDFERRRVETAEAQQKASEDMNIKLAEMENFRNQIAKSLADIQQAVEGRAEEKHPYVFIS
jgi:molecular chaperone GrpE (heat shock protein)